MLRWPDGHDADRFLAECWQKQPLFMPGALAGVATPLTPDELAGLACEDDVESRLVVHDAAGWHVTHGPLADTDFAGLPERDWTLLVHDVDKHCPALADVFSHFDFLPTWRMDDLMVSYAAPGGSVGAHVDAYDVFLLQATGEREWRVDPTPGSTASLPDVELDLLARFEPTLRYTARPGDVLYLPPGAAHHGVAQGGAGGECTTWSIGFRASSRAELLQDFARHLAEADAGDVRYGDPDLSAREVRGGYISTAAVNRAVRALAPLLEADHETLARWFGEHVTEPKPWLRPEPGDDTPAPADLAAGLARGQRLRRNGMSRLAWTANDRAATLFADGRHRELPPELAGFVETVSDRRLLDGQALGPWLDHHDALATLQWLYAGGTVAWSHED